MTSIRFRLFLLTMVALAAVGGLGSLAMKSFIDLKSYTLSMQQSFELEEKLPLLSQAFNKEFHASLQKERQTLQPEYRQKLFSDIIQAYAEQNPRLLHNRVSIFKKNETEYRRYVKPLIAFLQERTQYYAIMCLVAMMTGVFLIWLFVQSKIFWQMKNLSKKMIDFLNNRYTYQFNVPEQTEVGHLQATFNALAQRVLTNMEELQSLDNAKSEFLSIASHELRTPLTSIKGSLSLLKSGVVGQINDSALNLMRIAETETDRLIRLINDLLDLAKIEARKLPLAQSWHPLKPLMKSTIDSLQGLASQAQVQLVISKLPSVEVNMDKDRIQQVLTNLLSNAIKYSPTGGRVLIDCDMTSENHLLIEITDQGRGIAPEDQDLIFQKFRQATNSKNPLVKGTGLGLTIAKALVEEHAGKIGLRSAVDQGSTFYFTLPQWKFVKEEEPTQNIGVAA